MRPVSLAALTLKEARVQKSNEMRPVRRRPRRSYIITGTNSAGVLSLKRRARVPPIDYGDGLASRLTPQGNTEIRKCIQRRPHSPRATLIGIDRNG
jgi:hypothetical protein